MTKKTKPQTSKASTTTHTLRPVPRVVNLREVPADSIELVRELHAALMGGEISGIGVIAIRRHGLRPIVEVTDSAFNCPVVALGLAARLTYLLNRLCNEKA